jgi:hypothetical protein
MKIVIYQVALIILCWLSIAENKTCSNYQELQMKFEGTLFLFKNREYERAKKEFKNLIIYETNNFYWESYFYLSQIFLLEQKKDSANIILREGLKHPSTDWNAFDMYQVAIEAIKRNKEIELDDSFSYDSILDSLKKDLIIIHQYPDKMPVPHIGMEKLKNKLIAIISSYNQFKNIKKKMALGLVIDKNGNVGRVILSDELKIAEIKMEIYNFLFNTFWNPAISN